MKNVRVIVSYALLAAAAFVFVGCDGGPAEVEVSEAVFVLESLNGDVPGSDPPVGCPRVMSGYFRFDGLDERGSGRVVLKHTILLQRAPEIPLDTVVRHDTTTFLRRGSVVTIFPDTFRTADFDFIEENTALRSVNAGCYSGQREPRYDLPYVLMYRRASASHPLP